MKRVKGVVKTLVIIFLVLIFSYNIYNYVNTKILKNDITSVFGYAMLEVVSASMDPTIKIGDMIIIDTNYDNAQEGDIVTFYDVNDAFVTHRIASVDGDYIITKGDNNDSVDDKTNKSKIVGKYVLKLSQFGAVLASFRSPVTLTIILIMGIIICYLVSTDASGNPIDMVRELVSGNKHKRNRTNKGKRKEKRDNKK